MAYATPADVAAVTGVTYTAAQNTRLTALIPQAERFVARLAGQVFYDPAAATSDASQDWLTAVALVADAYLASEDSEAREARMGPFQSEKLGDYSYTLKGQSVPQVSDPRVMEIIAPYLVLSALSGVVVNGPAREAAVTVEAGDDVSRIWW